MNRRVQIVISTKPQGELGVARPLSLWQRLKVVLIGLGFASIGLGILIFLVILGSVIAAVLWAMFVLSMAYAVFRASLQRGK